MGQFKIAQIKFNWKGIYWIYFIPVVKEKASKREKIRI